MALFQKSVLKSQLEKLDEDLIQQSWETYKSYFLDASKQKIIFEKKEEELQYEFLLQLFDKSLGYDIGVGNQNLFVEQKNQADSKKADGAIKINGEIVCVIELKSTKTKNLKDVETQAFGYKVSHPNCKYVVTSNFNKLRFYIDNTTEFEEFDLFNLTVDRFKLLWLCLSYDSISSNKPLSINKESLVNEEKITKQLYKDYSEFRFNLFADLKENNPQVTPEILLQKTQKLLDRMLFIFFSEDRGLLPSNSITEIINYWENKKEFGDDGTLYDTYVTYFNVINKGRPQRGNKEAIYAYNGGLFIDDEVLDNLVISDDLLLEYSKKLTAYDFESDISVNILGHIFEHSLTEIEELQNQIENKELDKSKSKRKKDGVFYTPQYITKYIVENTVGKLCEEKKIELKIVEEEYLKNKKGRPEKKLKSLLNLLEQYREWLLGLTICDPACGSGAFLNQALEFLISEHNYIDELRTSLLDESIQFYDIENSILENNLYGVDINKESVEIAKLSLWLRTAQKGRKLTSLNNNIKCGNSLIDDPEVAGDKAFNWQNEFPKVFEKGGFDVVIGNPPYVRVQNLNYETIDFYKKKYDVCHQRVDLYLLFFEKSYPLLKEKGILSFINPTMFVNSDYGIGLRKYLKNIGLFEVIDFGDLPIFADATTYTGIFTIEKNHNKQFKYVKFDDLEPIPRQLYDKKRNLIDIDSLEDEGWTFSPESEVNLIKKLSKGTKIGDTCVINSGCFTGFDEAFFVSKETIELYSLEYDLIYPIIMGKEPKRYFLNNPEKRCIYPYEEVDGKTELIEEVKFKRKYPNTYNYLLQYKDSLLNRKDSRKTFLEMGRPWYSYTRKGLIQVFNSNKLLVGYIVSGNTFCADTRNFIFSVGRVFAIVPSEKMKLESLLGILNSSVSNYLMRKKCPIKQGGYFKISSKYLSDFTIPDSPDVDKINPFVRRAVNSNQTLNEKINSVVEFLESKTSSNISKALMKWYNLDFSKFLLELEKARKKYTKENEAKYIKLSLNEEAKWMQYFNEQKQKVEELKEEIYKTDKEIDQMVYELYGLTEEEIEIVENATK